MSNTFSVELESLVPVSGIVVVDAASADEAVKAALASDEDREPQTSWWEAASPDYVVGLVQGDFAGHKSLTGVRSEGPRLDVPDGAPTAADVLLGLLLQHADADEIRRRLDAMDAPNYEALARAAGYVEVPDTAPWGEGPGIVHGPTWYAGEAENDTAYAPGAWKTVCEDAGLVANEEGKASPAASMAIKLDQREFDTVLAALRNWQQTTNRDEMPEYEIALGEHGIPLDDDEIDRLCKTINTGGRRPAASLSADHGGTWSEHPEVPVADWQEEVIHGHTRLGYWEFVRTRLGDAEPEREEG